MGVQQHLPLPAPAQPPQQLLQRVGVAGVRLRGLLLEAVHPGLHRARGQPRPAPRRVARPVRGRLQGARLHEAASPSGAARYTDTTLLHFRCTRQPLVTVVPCLQPPHTSEDMWLPSSVVSLHRAQQQSKYQYFLHRAEVRTVSASAHSSNGKP